MNDAARDAAGKAAKRGVGTNHGLHRETKASQRVFLWKRNCFEMFQQRRALIPQHALAEVNDVVSFNGADGHALNVCDSQLSCEREKIVLQFKENIFAILNEIHFVDSGKDVGNSQERSNESVTSRLREEPLSGIYQNDCEVRR